MRQKYRKTQAAILDAAAARWAANPGASLGEIAADAGVGRATLHRYFPSREALARELALDALRACDEACTEIEEQASSAADALARVIAALVPLGDRVQCLVSLPEVFQDTEVVGVCRRQSRETADLVEAAKAEGGLDPTVPTAWIVEALDALIYAAWTAVQDGRLAKNDAALFVDRTLFHGLAPSSVDSRRKS